MHGAWRDSAVAAELEVFGIPSEEISFVGLPEDGIDSPVSSADVEGALLN